MTLLSPTRYLVAPVRHVYSGRDKLLREASHRYPGPDRCPGPSRAQLPGGNAVASWNGQGFRGEPPAGESAACKHRAVGAFLGGFPVGEEAVVWGWAEGGMLYFVSTMLELSVIGGPGVTLET